MPPPDAHRLRWLVRPLAFLALRLALEEELDDWRRPLAFRCLADRALLAWAEDRAWLPPGLASLLVRLDLAEEALGLDLSRVAAC